MAVLALPAILPARAPCPKAMLLLPERLLNIALLPIALFMLPLVLLISAKPPMPRLEPPVVFALSALAPYAVLEMPVVRFKRASSPAAVLKAGKVSSGSVMTACALGKSAKHTDSSEISSKPWLEFLILVFIWVNLSLFSGGLMFRFIYGTLETNKQTRRVKFVWQFQVHGRECAKNPTDVSSVKIRKFSVRRFPGRDSSIIEALPGSRLQGCGRDASDFFQRNAAPLHRIRPVASAT